MPDAVTLDGAYDGGEVSLLICTITWFVAVGGRLAAATAAWSRVGLCVSKLKTLHDVRVEERINAIHCIGRFIDNNDNNNILKLEALGQCTPPPRHILLVSRWGSGIRIRIRDPDRHQNWIICSLAVAANLPWKSQANPFGRFFAKLLTDRQRRKHILIGGDNNIHRAKI